MSMGVSPESVKWHTNVTELLVIFRTALLTLIPILERANIPWREPYSYDEWDEIADVLFRNIVVRSIQYSMNQEKKHFEIPRYDYVYDDYSGKCFIAVLPQEHSSNSHLLFHSFSTQLDALDTIRCRRVDHDVRLSVQELEFVPVKGTKFAFANRGRDGGLELIFDLDVET
jgi:hypothetical protein